VVRLLLVTLPAEAAKTAVGTSSAAVKNVDIEGSDLRHKPGVSCITLGQSPLPIGWRGRESRKFPLMFVVGADDNVDVSHLAYCEVLSLGVKKVLQRNEVHSGILFAVKVGVGRYAFSFVSIRVGRRVEAGPRFPRRISRDHEFRAEFTAAASSRTPCSVQAQPMTALLPVISWRVIGSDRNFAHVVVGRFMRHAKS
jgi:hypothetical protein